MNQIEFADGEKWDQAAIKADTTAAVSAAAAISAAPAEPESIVLIGSPTQRGDVI